jgi:hypothetical protein
MIKYTTDTLETLKVDAIGIISAVYDDKDATDFLEDNEENFNSSDLTYFAHYCGPKEELAFYQEKKNFDNYQLFLGDVRSYVPWKEGLHATLFLMAKSSGISSVQYDALLKALLKTADLTKSSSIAFPYNLGCKEELDWKKICLLIEVAFMDREVIIFDAPKQLVKKQNSLWSRIKRLFS